MGTGAGVVDDVADGVGLGLGSGVVDGLGDADGVGLGDADGVGVGVTDGLGADGLGLGDADGAGVGVTGVGVGLGLGAGVGVGAGLGVGSGVGVGVGVNPALPPDSRRIIRALTSQDLSWDVILAISVHGPGSVDSIATLSSNRAFSPLSNLTLRTALSLAQLTTLASMKRVY